MSLKASDSVGQYGLWVAFPLSWKPVADSISYGYNTTALDKGRYVEATERPKPVFQRTTASTLRVLFGHNSVEQSLECRFTNGL